MPSAEQLRIRLLKKLSELFQLDQPDLDFGFYRIMHAKAQEVQDFIGTDLLKIVADAFGDVDDNRKTELLAAYEKAIQTAKDFGAPNPDETEPVKKAKAALDAVKDTASAEADVYDHLYRFFERYYDDGDFISRRYYTRETSGKAAPFAVPYNGEEVKLHWANADQYYIKSTEYFSNFTFDLTEAAEVRKMSKEERTLSQIPDSPLKVHFRVVEATEGEHGNVNASEANKRFFILHAENPVALTETGELAVNFEYRPDPEKTGQENTWRDKRNSEAVQTILKELESGILKLEGGEAALGLLTPNSKILDSLKEYLRLFKVPAPTDSDKKRPVLAKYVNQYTARNTMDYFIHKDLGGFLRRELDFYIKNEVMRLDDIENAEAPAVESYLAKLKVLRKIAGKLIDFLAQLEDFQKKLWLKKKFVTETNYCITLDRINPDLFPEIASNDAQFAEWVKLGFIEEDEIEEIRGLLTADLRFESEEEFKLEAEPNNQQSKIKNLKFLVLDTAFFSSDFKAKLIASIEDFDEQCDGLLIHSENFQALNLLQERYREQVKCVYIDPPYNTGDDGFVYKDAYQHSSWSTLMHDRLSKAKNHIQENGWLFISIDEREHHRLLCIVEEVFGPNIVSTITVKMSHLSGMKMSNVDRKPPKIKEYLVMVAANTELSRIIPEYERADWHDVFDRYTGFLDIDETNPQKCEKWVRVNLKKKAQSVGVDIDNKVEFEEWAIQHAQRIFRTAVNDSADIKNTPKDNVFRKIITPTGLTKFVYNKEEVLFASTYLKEIDGKNVPAKILSDIWIDIGINNLHNEGGIQFQNGKKPLKLIERVIKMAVSDDGLILDFFSGSGSTAHAVMSLNQKLNTKKKFVCIELGDHFNYVLLNRIKKVAFSKDWLLDKPTSKIGQTVFVKYIRLESYEDTLNNLVFDDNPVRKKAIESNQTLKEDYMLRYLLDVETRGSQSLLNIDAFADPTAYTLEVKKPGTDEYATRAVDLIETFNYLIGLRVLHTSVPQIFQATFKRITDPELPEDQHTKLVVDGRIRQDEGGSWWFRKVEGWVPKDPANPNNGQREKVLIVWRKLTDDIEQDNLMLDEWFQKNRISTRDFEFDTIYVNGSNNLPNLKLDDENWKVRLIEEEFMKRMWNGDSI